ncbi:hypothetical protein DAH66_17540 [Sphingomonas koreensis]|uniref:Alanine-rich protein n=1 Tax=Sphingomonas koreensis TaxID=93064 RepID=A0A430FZS5_9SPHN|nr:hypothetical protein [Sphingomonas koreensis]RSY79367.1 hypothetical protein DAH66_17540 [Sphingomonas koreensis]
MTRSFGYYTYPWNLHDPAGDLAAMADDGMAHVAIAASYHAGKFIQPRDPVSRVYFPEDGTVYFTPRSTRYGLLQPLRARAAEARDVLREACDAAALQVRAWTVLNHNSRLGWLHPEVVSRNAWGDPYYYALCPSHPEVRRYAVTLAADLAEHHDLHSLMLESPGWLVYDHGYHHEFAQAQPTTESTRLMGLCFCDSCTVQAGAAGIDMAGLRGEIRRQVDAQLDDTRNGEIVPPDELAAFHAWRCCIVTTLCAEIRAAVRPAVAVRVISTCQRPHATCYLEGGDLAALAQVTDGLELPLYQPSADAVAGDLADVVAAAGSTERLSAILRPGYPDMSSEAQLRDTLARLAAAGIDDISFYNYGLLPADQIDWVRRAVHQSGGA